MNWGDAADVNINFVHRCKWGQRPATFPADLGGGGGGTNYSMQYKIPGVALTTVCNSNSKFPAKI